MKCLLRRCGSKEPTPTNCFSLLAVECGIAFALAIEKTLGTFCRERPANFEI